MFLIIILYFILALTFVFAKNAVLICSPVFFIGVRMTIAGFLLLLPEIIRNKKLLPCCVKRSDVFLFVLVTFFHIYIPFLGEFWALQYVDALKVNFLFALTPFFAIILESIFYQKIPSLQKIIGTLIGFVALFLILHIHGNHETWSFSQFFSLTFPEFILLTVVMSGTLAWFYIKKLTAKDFSIATINGLSMFVGGILSLITAFLFENIVIKNQLEFFKQLALLILFSNIIFYNLYGKLLQYYSISFLTVCGFLVPFFGMVIESILRQQLPNSWYYGAFFALVIGLLLVAREEKQ